MTRLQLLQHLRAAILAQYPNANLAILDDRYLQVGRLFPQVVITLEPWSDGKIRANLVARNAVNNWRIADIREHHDLPVLPNPIGAAVDILPPRGRQYVRFEWQHAGANWQPEAARLLLAFQALRAMLP